MIEESGTVIARVGDQVWVRTIRRSTCGQCQARHGCGQGALASLSDGRANQLQMVNAIDANVGDTVVVGIGERQLLMASALVYGVPMLGLLLGALVGGWLGPGQDLSTLLGGGLGAGVSFAGVRWLSARRLAPALSPVLLRAGDGTQRIPLNNH
ncbi:RseC/MucC-like positive regulator of sigma(E) [Tamilnaduibacter salinus]|uniref:RseC/MucC-like positive regulator of sigma(E) n=1 Tax=Tamilnaduibacter salinus TaxID=1484056 RepID=A0A2A2I728_9GAMM|nr:SoxR reducing system RseC family protein [Tamilnaduibacter salinus]PAV27188.1 sigma E positive regulator RseC/MucC [Tamilnaduibacter salinus]PVY78978.1 RseC/MucC-like positive regulator of sigma(E) [Tamilnaduibacter salinus]